VTEHTKSLTLRQRKELASRIPWVRRRSVRSPCEGIRYSTVALRDIYTWGPQGLNPPRGIQERSRCRLNAEWNIVLLRRRLLNTGYLSWTADLCWRHLLTFMSSSSEDEDRLNNWLRANGFPNAGMSIPGDATGGRI
jgi:hypothetical protein